MSIYNKNLESLRSSQPSLAHRVRLEPKQNSVQVVLAKDGNPVPQFEGISLHSNYYPLKEAFKLIDEFVIGDKQDLVVYGLGFGYHILEIQKKYPNKGILVIEPLMTIFQAFLESVDLERFNRKIKFIIAELPPKILASHDSRYWNVFEHSASRRVSNAYFEAMDKARETSYYLSNNKLKILVINPYYGGSLPTAKYCVQALNSLGHQAESVQCEAFVEGYSSLVKVTRNSTNAEILSNQFNHFMGQFIAAKAADFGPDMILALAQAPLSTEAIKNLKSMEIPIAFWFVEDFKTLTYWKEIASSYDYFFTIQRGKFFEELDTIEAKNYYYLPQACLPDIHREVQLSTEEMNDYSSAISFMGAGYYNRAQSFSRLLGHEFKIWGTEWDLKSPLGKRVQNKNKRINSEEVVKIYNAGKININLHSSSFHKGVNPEGDFVNPRTFEIPACGGFQLVDERSELAELLDPGSEVATFCSIDELCEKLEYYLNHENEAKAIVTHGKKRILNEHTIQHRMREMLIHIYFNRLEQLKERLSHKYRDPLNYCIDEAGPSTSLGKYLNQFQGENNFSIKTMIDHIADGEGVLSNEELLILMVNQLVKSES